MCEENTQSKVSPAFDSASIRETDSLHSTDEEPVLYGLRNHPLNFSDFYDDVIDDRCFIDCIVDNDEIKRDVFVHPLIATLSILAGLIIQLGSPIVGCIMWFRSFPIQIILLTLITAEPIGFLLCSYHDPKESWSEICIKCIASSICTPIYTAILIAFLEGILWLGSWIVSVFA